MTNHISPSIIMRIREVGESDLIVTFFTPDRGRLKGIAKGARRSRKRFPNCLDLFCLVTLEYEQARRGGLYFLHSCKLIDAFLGLRNKFHMLSLASYMVELTEILFPTAVVDQDMFMVLKKSLSALSNGCRADTLRVIFEAKAMALGGYKIGLERCCVCGRPYTGKGVGVFKQGKGGIACLRCQQETAITPRLDPESIKYLRLIQTTTWTDPCTLTCTDKTLNEIKAILKLHIAYRIGRKIRAQKYLQ